MVKSIVLTKINLSKFKTIDIKNLVAKHSIKVVLQKYFKNIKTILLIKNQILATMLQLSYRKMSQQRQDQLIKSN